MAMAPDPALLPRDDALRNTTHAQAALARRAVALIIDLLLLSAVDYLIDAVFGVAHPVGGSLAPLASGSVVGFVSATDIGWVGLLAVMVSYFAVPEALFGATPGKWCMGLRVTSMDGRPLSVWAAVLRNVLRPIDALAGYLAGALFVFTSPSRQRLGDRVAGTLVVAQAAVAGPARSAAALRWRGIGLAIGLGAAMVLSGLFAYYGRPPLVIQGWANTHSAIFEAGVAQYRLGSPQWGDGTVSYPVTYEPAGPHPVACNANVTLRWMGPLDGWQMAYSFIYCPSGQ